MASRPTSTLPIRSIWSRTRAAPRSDCGARHRRLWRGAGSQRHEFGDRAFSAAATPCWCIASRTCRPAVRTLFPAGAPLTRASMPFHYHSRRGPARTAERRARRDMECGFDAAHQRAPSGASSRIASPAPFGAAVTPARHPHPSAAASISAISASRSGGAITRTEQAALISPSASQFPDRSLPQMLPRSTTTCGPSGRMMRVSAANRAKCAATTTWVMHGKSLGHDQDCIGGDGCNGRNLQIGARKKDVRIGNHRAKSPILHRHRVPHQRTLLAPVMDDGGSLRGEIERRAGADRHVQRQPVRGVKSSGRRLQESVARSGRIRSSWNAA